MLGAKPRGIVAESRGGTSREAHHMFGSRFTAEQAPCVSFSVAPAALPKGPGPSDLGPNPDLFPDRPLGMGADREAAGHVAALVAYQLCGPCRGVGVAAVLHPWGLGPAR